MARRKNTAECYEILLKIAKKQAAARQRQEEKAAARGEEVEGEGEGDAGRQDGRGGDAGRSRFPGARGTPSVLSGPSAERPRLPWTNRLDAASAGAAPHEVVGDSGLASPAPRRRAHRWIEHPGSTRTWIPGDGVEGATLWTAPGAVEGLDADRSVDGGVVIDLLEAKEPLGGFGGGRGDLRTGGTGGGGSSELGRGEGGLGSRRGGADLGGGSAARSERFGAGLTDGNGAEPEPESGDGCGGPHDSDDPDGRDRSDDSGSQPDDGASDEPRRASGRWQATLRPLRWLAGDSSTRFLSQPIQLRLSTLILGALGLAIALALFGIWLKIDPRPADSAFRDRLFDDRAALEGAQPASGAFATGDGTGMVASSHTAGGVDADGSDGALPPLEPGEAWKPDPARAARPEVRQLEQRETLPAVTATTPDTRWVRVKAMMDKKECYELIDHLALLRQSLEQEHGCEDGSLACKRIEFGETDQPDGTRYHVDIGPFASYDDASRAKAELSDRTSRAPHVFKRKNYFAPAYSFQRR